MDPAATDVVYRPPEGLVKKTRIWRFMDRNGLADYDELIRRSTEDVPGYWDAVNEDLGIEWFRHYEKVLDLSAGAPWAKWFVGGKCNIVHNCLDRHVRDGLSSRAAFRWEGEDGQRLVITYGELLNTVNRLANGLRSLGVRRGDVVGVYMPMIPQAIATMLACSRMGAIHAVVFSGFSPPALAARLNDSGAKALVTADGYYRRGKLVDLKRSSDEALKSCAAITRQVVCRYAGNQVSWKPTRDVWFDDLTTGRPELQPEAMESEDALYILYTSGTTGRPKGSVHVHGGYTLFAGQQAAYLIDIQPGDVLFWPADIGWITGQTWTVYGNLIAGGTAVVYDGSFDHPRPDRWWDLIEEHKVTVFGSSPTAIRMLKRSNASPGTSHDLSRLRILASTGEPLNPSEWTWLFEKVGGSSCPVINLTGGTEVGGAFLSPLPIIPLKPSTVGGPVPGIAVDVVDEAGAPARGKDGYVVVRKPWPGMTRGIWKDPGRYIETYWSRFDDVWFHGDWAMVDQDGYWFLHGRVDDVIKVSGYRVGSAEIESALQRHPAVHEAAAVGLPDELKGEALVVCVVLKENHEPTEQLKKELKSFVEEQIAKIVRPDEVKFVKDLPKTRTGKIVRRMVRAKLLGMDPGDLTTLENPDSLEALGRLPQN